MTKFTTENMDLATMLDKSMKQHLKDKIEYLLREELKAVLESEPVGDGNSRNGYYPRTLDTKYGHVDLSVPRDRKGQHQTTMFEPYARRMVAVDELVVQLYQHGVSVRQVGSIMKNLLGEQYSQGTISNITSAVLEDVEKWQKRPLKKRYFTLYLDALYAKVRRDVVGKEAVYIALGIDQYGHREILGFYVGGTESATGWQEILDDLKNRGLEEVLLGIFDGLSGLEVAFRNVFPKADIQRCVVHKMRSIMTKARKRDQAELSLDLKKVYRSDTYEEAEKALKETKKKWQKSYSRELETWDTDLPVLMTFLKYPKEIQKYIYTTNMIERTNKEVRKRLKTMNSLPNIEAAEKIVYLTAKDYNERWATRKLSGFDLARDEIAKMFEKRYGNKGE